MRPAILVAGRVMLLAMASAANATAPGQSIMDWSSAGDGLYLDAANWSPQNVPGDDCCAAESARFALSGNRRIELPASGAPSPDQVIATAGRTDFEAPLGTSTSTLAVAGSTELASGAWVTVGERVIYHSPMITIDGGDPTEDARLELTNGSTSVFDEVIVGGPSGAGRDAVLSVFSGADVSIGNITVGAADHLAALEAAGGTIQQTASASTVVGQAGGALALLVVSNSGVLDLGSGGVTVAGAGRLLNSGGEVHFGGDVTLGGGVFSYRESGGGSTRSFAAGSTVTIHDGAVAAFDPATLELDDGQALAIVGPTGQATAAGAVDFGASSELRLTLDAANLAPSAPIDAAGVVTLAGQLAIDFVTPPVGLAPGYQQTLIEAGGGLTGAFADVSIPAVAGIAWRLEQGPTALTLVADAGVTGDYNGDGIVTAADYTVWRDTYDETINLAADGDGDGRIDAEDYVIWKNASLASAVGAGQPVPAPAGVGALFSAFLLTPAGGRRLRRQRRSC